MIDGALVVDSISDIVKPVSEVQVFANVTLPVDHAEGRFLYAAVSIRVAKLEDVVVTQEELGREHFVSLVVTKLATRDTGETGVHRSPSLADMEAIKLTVCKGLVKDVCEAHGKFLCLIDTARRFGVTELTAEMPVVFVLKLAPLTAGTTGWLVRICGAVVAELKFTV